MVFGVERALLASGQTERAGPLLEIWNTGGSFLLVLPLLALTAS